MPLVGFDPVQFGFAGTDDAVQAVAFTEAHERADEAPEVTDVGVADNSTLTASVQAAELIPLTLVEESESPTEFDATR